MRKSILVIIVLISYTNLHSQNFSWAKGISGATVEIAHDVAVDAANNVYVTGSFQGTVDFDPGPGTFTIACVSANYPDLFIMKLNPAGNLTWVKRIGGASQEIGYSIAVDPSGNVYTTGCFGANGASGVDFDPGPGVFNMSTCCEDIYVNKLDPNGNFVWAKNFSSAGSTGHTGISLVLDGSGNVYTMGLFQTTTDFDPGPGTYTLTTTGSALTTFVSKLDGNGNFVWARSFGNNFSEYGNSLTIDGAANTYVTGSFISTVDFDPGPGTFTVTSAGNTDAYINKLDVNGNFVWVKTIGGPNFESGTGIASDAVGNLYMTSDFTGTLDFDPGPGTFNMTASPQNGFVMKLDPSGNFSWAKNIGIGAFPRAISLDASSNPYSTGYFTGTPDFDPSATTFTITSNGQKDVFIHNLDVTGNFGWAAKLGGNVDDMPYSITVNDPGSNFYTCGTFKNSADFDPGSGTYSLTSAGVEDAFISMLTSSCTPPSAPVDITSASNKTICSGNSSTLTVIGTGTVSWYPTSTSTTSIATGSVYITPVLSSGTYTYYAQSDTCASSLIRTAITVSVNPTPTVNVSSSQTITCAAPTAILIGSGVSSYTWSGPGTILGSNSPTAGVNTPGTFSLTGTSSGCVSNTATVTVYSNTTAPTLSTSASNNPICAGQSTTLSVTGANTYSWSTGTFSQSIVVSPTISTPYYVTGTNTANGCVGSGLKYIGVNPLPPVTAATSTFCSGTTGCLYGGGATTYAWVGPCSFVSNMQSPCFPYSGICGCTFTLTGTDANGCQNTATVCMNVLPNPTITTASSNSLICAGQTATLSSNGALTYSWSTSTTGSNTAVTPTINTTYTVIGTDTNGCMDTDTITQYVSACTGIRELSVNQFQIYPNPTSGEIILKTDRKENVSVEVYNTVGEMILKQTITAYETKIDLKEKANGIYFVKIISGNNFVTEKIIKN